MQLIRTYEKKQRAYHRYVEMGGVSYWDAFQIIRDRTKLNHLSIHQKIADKLDTTIIDTFWDEHNFVFKNGDLFYHAKGATP